MAKQLLGKEVTAALNERIKADVAKLNEKGIQKEDVVGLGVGVPAATKDGIVNSTSNIGWGYKNVRKELEELTGYHVNVGNDANVAALGEYWMGGGKGFKDMIFVTLGTGVGGGIILRGRIFSGCNFFGGELGHFTIKHDGLECGCGRKGCLEAYASAIGIKRTAFELMATMNDKSPLRDISFNDLDSAILYQHAVKGDPIAKEAFRLTGMRLGYALADAVTITSPEAIFVFGGLAKAGDVILDPIKWYLEENMLFAFKNKVKVLPSGLQNKNAAILGASALVWQNL